MIFIFQNFMTFETHMKFCSQWAAVSINLSFIRIDPQRTFNKSMSSPLRYEGSSGESAGKRMPGVGKDKYSTEFGILGASSVLAWSMKKVGKFHNVSGEL